MCLWRIFSIVTKAQSYVNMGSGGRVGQKGHEVVFTTTAMPWSGKGVHENQPDLVSVLSGLLIAVQVQGSHLSAWLMSAP